MSEDAPKERNEGLSDKESLWAPTERSTATEVQYARKFEALQRQYRDWNGIPARDSINLLDFANWIVDKVEPLKPNTQRFNRSAAKHGFLHMASPDATEAYEAMVRRFKEMNRRKGPRRDEKPTNPRHKRVIKDAERDKIIQEAQKRQSHHAQVLVAMLVAGLETGLRPHEWTDAILLMNQPPENLNGCTIEDLKENKKDDLNQDINIWKKTKGPWLVVKNAKNSNGRACGDYRIMALGNIAKERPLSIECIENVINIFKEIEEVYQVEQYIKPTIYKLMEGIKKTLSRIEIKLWGKSRFSIYATRHTFAARAKKTYGAKQIAALMGHASTRTARKHYGRMNNSSSTAVGALPVPDPRNIALVRRADVTMGPKMDDPDADLEYDDQACDDSL